MLGTPDYTQQPASESGNAGSALARVQAALAAAGCKRSGQSGWSCPAHEDHQPSLSVNAGPGYVKMHCHAGCRTEDVVSVLALSTKDLFDRPLAAVTDIEAEYEYRDECGVLLYVRERRYGKKFFFRRPDSAGGWAWSLGARRVLYNLGPSRAAAAAGGTVYVTEGEKDADALTALGLTATTNPGGANEIWTAEYSAVLAGAQVIIIADRDEPGYKHARQAAISLKRKAASVAVMQPAVTGEHADVSDHLAAGYGIDELVPLPPDAELRAVKDVEQKEQRGAWSQEKEEQQEEDQPKARLALELASQYGTPDDPWGADIPLGDDEPPLPDDEPAPASILNRYRFENWQEIFDRTPEQVQWLREPVLERGTLNVIYGDRGTGKSLFAQEQAALLATAGRKVLYLDNENRKVEYRDRLRDMGYGPADLAHLLLLWFSALPPLDTREGGRDLRDLVTATAAELVVIDTRSRFAKGKENDSNTYIDVYNYTLAPLKKTGTTVVLLDHCGKNRELGPRGSSAKGGDIDTEWEIAAPKDSKFRYLTCTKNRAGRVEAGYKITLEKIAEPHFRHGWILPEGKQRSEANDRQESLADALDRLGVPKNAGRPTAEKALVKAGVKFDTHVLGEVIRTRKEAVRHFP